MCWSLAGNLPRYLDDVPISMRRCKAEVPPSHVWLVEGVPKKNQSYWTYKPIYKPLLLKLQAQLIVNDSFIIRFDFWLNISYHTMLIFAMMLLVITSKSIYIYIHTLFMSQFCSDLISWHHLQCVCRSCFSALFWVEDEEDETFCRLLDLQTTCRCDFACGSLFDTPERGG